MYTLHMTWSFRALALSIAMVWALVPQLACFMPDPALTPAEMDCCKQMANDCSGMNMSHECCRTPGHTDVGIVAQAARVKASHVADAVMLHIESFRLSIPLHEFFVRGSHAPPPDPEGASPLVLRI